MARAASTRRAKTAAPPVELVPVDAIEPHPSNPNEGDVGEVADLLVHNGWFGTVELQRRDDGYRLIAGETRWRAVRMLQAQGGIVRSAGKEQLLDYDELCARCDELGLPPLPPAGSIYAQVYDVNDRLARRHLLADNEANRKASYDRQQLLEVLREQQADEGSLLGTAFDGDDLDDLQRSLDAPDLDDVDAQLGGRHQDGDLKSGPRIVIKVERRETVERWHEVFGALPGDNDTRIGVILDHVSRDK